jgi:hypothetical protein
VIIVVGKPEITVTAPILNSTESHVTNKRSQRRLTNIVNLSTLFTQYVKPTHKVDVVTVTLAFHHKNAATFIG